ncbi:MAG TPA: hypothetical protein VMZ30_00580 [Pyrinomonadaceae bacterium]|nr:hypothetical protein [Pyrinomonadaceae bacterium]
MSEAQWIPSAANHRQWASSTINVAQQGLKKFFKITCPQDWATLKLLRVRGEFKLPVVISIGEVHTFLKLVDKPSMLCFFNVVYALGLRLETQLGQSWHQYPYASALLCNPSPGSRYQPKADPKVHGPRSLDDHHDLSPRHNRRRRERYR